MAAMRAKQQVIQAMALAADQNQYPGLVVCVMKPCLHGESLRYRREILFQRFDRGCLRQGKMYAQEELFGAQIPELLGVDDVAVQAQQPVAHLMHNANAVWAGKRE